jgi:hypothetical protein
MVRNHAITLVHDISQCDFYTLVGLVCTVWGEVQDAASFAVIDKVWDLPAHDTDGLTLLNKDIPFQIVIVSSEVE